MTCKREDREALIEAVKVAIQKRAQWRSLHWPNVDALAHGDVARALAEATVAVFEQAHTPTDDELATLAEWLRQGAPFDSETWGQYQDQLDYAASTITDLRRPVDGTPTDDEREALAITDAEWRESQAIPEQGYSHRHWVDARIAERVMRDRRRPVQGEPSRPLTPCGNIACTGCRECGCPALGIEPQGEPTDKAVQQMQDELEYRVRTAAALVKGGHDINAEVQAGRARIGKLAFDFGKSQAEQGEPEWEYRCTGPDGDTPRRFATESEVAWHMKSGCGEVQRRKAGPWLPVPDTTNREIRADDEPNCCGAGEWVCSSTCSAPKWTALEEATNNESEG